MMSLRASILVADDDQTSARFLKRLLTKEGHSVAVVQTGGEALDACRSAPPDLVLVDLVAERGEGFVNAQAAEEGGEEEEEEAPARGRRGAARAIRQSAADRSRASNRGRR